MNTRSGKAAAPFPKFAIALAFIACMSYLGSELFLFSRLGFPLDDGWIHLQFARQVSLGDGLTYNPGTLVTGSTSPLWTVLLSIGFSLPLPPLVWAKLLGIGFFLGTVIASDRLALELGARGLARKLTAIWVASTHWLVWSALSGMEIPLFSCLGLWGMVCHLQEGREPKRTPWSLPILALAALARPEGYLLLLLALADRLLSTLRADGRTTLEPGRIELFRRFLCGLGCALVLVVPVLLFHQVVGGSWFPTTFAVKASAPTGLLPDKKHLRTMIGILFDAQPFALIFAGAGGIRLLLRFAGGEHRGLLPPRGLLPLLWPAGLLLAYSSLSAAKGPLVVGNFGRYLFPLVPVIAVLATVGLGSVLERWQSLRIGGRPRRLGLALACLLLVPQVFDLYRGPLRYTQSIANVEDSDVRAANWLRERLSPDALLAVQDIGAIKFHLPNHVLDLAGIVTPEVVPLLRSDDSEYWEQKLLRFLEHRQPDYLVVFPDSYPMLSRQTPGFLPVVSFKIPQNVTMAGDELTIFATPWNRFPLAFTAE